MRISGTLMLLGLALCSATGLGQGRRVSTFPYAQSFTWITGATTAFPLTNVDGGEFTLDAGTTGWTTAIVSHGLNNNGGSGNALRIQTTAGVNNGVAGFVWYGDFTGYCADSLGIDWSKVASGTAGSRTNELRIGTNGGGGTSFTDLPLGNVAGGAWPVFDNTAAAQSGSLRVKLPASLGGAPDARIRIYSINTGGAGSQPRVLVDNLAVTAAGAPAPGSIDSIGGITNSSLVLSTTAGPGADSIVVVRRMGSAPTATPGDGIRYAPNQGLNNADTVAFAGPATARSIPCLGLQANTAYYFSVYGFRSCNGRYSTAVTRSARTLGGCADGPAGITSAVNIAQNQSSAVIGFSIGARTDSLLVIIRTGAAPRAVPVDGVRYRTGEALNGTDTVVYAGPPSMPLSIANLLPDSLYVLAIYALQSCSGTYSATPALDTVRTLASLAITGQPHGGTACVGSGFAFSVSAIGPNIRYQWRKNGVDIFGATARVYAVNHVALSDAGRYDVVISSQDNPAGDLDKPVPITTRTSDSAMLAVAAPPAIAAEPTDVSVCRGTPAFLAVAATGDGLAYQWRHDGVAIPGATHTAYAIDAAEATDAGAYDVMITGDCDPPVTSRSAHLTVNADPAVTDSPRAQAACPGGQAVFGVAASGIGLSYQWRKNGVPVAGAVSVRYVIDSVTNEDAGTYDVIVRGTCGTAVASNAAALAINTAPIIITQPLDQTSAIDKPVTFTVEASGSGTLRYQWQKNGVDIPGATSPRFTVRSVAVADIAGYNCAVGNDCTPPMTVTNSAWLFTSGTPGIITPPKGRTVCAGEPITLRVAATGAGLHFAWSRDGDEIPGAHRPDYIIPRASAADQGAYVCVITAPAQPPLTTPAAMVIVEEPPVITTQPAGCEVCRGARATFEIAATGAGLHFQWRHDGRAVAGANAAGFVLPTAYEADTGLYDCIVSGSCGVPATSAPARLNLTPAPQIVAQPTELVVGPGERASFRVEATGTGLSYEWRRNNRTIPGANTNVLSIASAAAGDAGYYDAVVGNCSGLVVSKGALLRVERGTGIPRDERTSDSIQFYIMPNPVDGAARFDVQMPTGVQATIHARMRLFDLLGNDVAVVADYDIVNGHGTAWLDTRSLPSGSYYCRFEAPGWASVVRMVVVVR